ncbi:hypothetical protein ACLOJK_001261 [Asimina triloba]
MFPIQFPPGHDGIDTTPPIHGQPPTNLIQWVAPSRQQQQDFEAYKMKKENTNSIIKQSIGGAKQRVICKGQLTVGYGPSGPIRAQAAHSGQLGQAGELSRV